jgi:NAD(P)-dependent dehydrogenase (short-subunit alcohol dehydrogenase family)
MRLAGKTAIVTGAARGIGRACAVRFAQEGADLALLDIAADLPEVPYPLGSAGQLDHTATLCRKHGAAVLTVPGDIRDPATAAEVVAQAVDRFGGVDVLVSNAGVVAPSGGPAHELTEEEWAVLLDINLSGAWRMTKAVAPLLIERRGGSIINISCTAGLVGYRHFAGYVAAKHGLVGLTRATAQDYAPFQVRVNAICPGSVRDDPVYEGRMLTEMARSMGVPVEESEATFLPGQPMNTLLEAEDVAAAAAWLASDDARQVTAGVFPIDGGYSAR